MLNRKAQVTIFIIIAILIVALSISIYIFYPQIFPAEKSRAEIAEEYFLQCIREKTLEGQKIMAFHGGYIELPEFETGSTYMPFSNQFSFLGSNIPYWFYVSGNNLQKMQKPSKQIMEEQLSNYINDKLSECDFSIFEFQGFNFSYGNERIVETSIQKQYIETTVNWPLRISVDEKTTVINQHRTRINTQFGQLYEDAETLFDSEVNEMFLENYSLDVLRLNAPVSGFEISCVPKTWNKAQLKSDLQQALQDNLATLKIQGNSYSLSGEDRRYFVYNPGKSISSQANFIYLQESPMRFEVYPSENNLLRADPIGNQQGINLAGFCYVPYHFVYDMSFPVMIQLYNNGEIFQFPVVVVIDKTNPRNSLFVENITQTPNLCNNEYRIQDIEIYTFDQNNNPINAKIYYKCLDKVCDLGETEREGSYNELKTKIPACYNGQIIATSEGYKDYSFIVSSNEPFTANLFLDKIYSFDLDMNLNSDEKALVSFNSIDYSYSSLYPDERKINLSRGTYDVSVFVFKDSQITLGSQQQEQCIEVPVGGIGSIFGLTREECFTIDMPEQTITSVIIGGGTKEISFYESDLKAMNKITISFSRFSTPTTIDELSNIMTAISSAELAITKS